MKNNFLKKENNNEKIKEGCSGQTYHIFFRNLANPLKIGIITSLKENPSTVSEIVDNLGVEQSKVSHALQALNHCKIVQYEQKGKKRIYSLNKKTIVPMLNLIDKHKCTFCKGIK